MHISAFLGESEGVHEAETLESLRILQKLVSTKLDAYAKEMEAQAFDDKSLPIVAVVDRTEKYMVRVQNAPAEEIQKTLGDLFGGEFLGGLHNLVSAALNELLGNTAAGEKEMRAFHVVYANNNILRVDYHMYKYDFSSKGLRDKMQNALCYVVQTSVLDLKKIDPQVVLYELDKSIGADNIKAATEKLHEEAKYMKELYKVINHLRVASMTPAPSE